MEILLEKDVTIGMRDGTRLVADVWRPKSESPLPVLLQRTPYNKEMAVSPEVMRLARAGYAVVIQDVRGRFASGGVFDPFRSEGSDGEDTIAWAAAQPWSSGEVGMLGPSYVGATQWLAAAKGPAALRSIAPNITGDDYYEGWSYQGGALQLGFLLTWATVFLGLADAGVRLGKGTGTREDFQALVHAGDQLATLFRHTPTVDIPHLGSVAPYWRDWLSHPSYDDFWRGLAPKERYADVVVPALNIGGWYDIFLRGTLANYRGMRSRGGSAPARRSRLLVGPWAHANVTGEFPERLYGLAGSSLLADVTGQQLRWFDATVRGIDNGTVDEPPVRLFVMGANTWRSAEDWPLPETEYVRFYLHSSGRAGEDLSDGVLSPAAPGAQPDDVLVYDPADPVPTVGGATFLPGLVIAANAGPRDQREVEARPDVLCFTTPVLQEPTTVIGPVTLVLHVASSAPDTDFTGKLVDVHPDGRAEILCDGILRLRYRNSLAAPELAEPGRPYEITIDLGATGNEFPAGHRIRVEVSSSNFPRYDRNSNTGGVIATERAENFRVATNRVLHDADRPSYLLLPIVPE